MAPVLVVAALSMTGVAAALIVAASPIDPVQQSDAVFDVNPPAGETVFVAATSLPRAGRIADGVLAGARSEEPAAPQIEQPVQPPLEPVQPPVAPVARSAGAGSGGTSWLTPSGPPADVPEARTAPVGRAVVSHEPRPSDSAPPAREAATARLLPQPSAGQSQPIGSGSAVTAAPQFAAAARPAAPPPPALAWAGQPAEPQHDAEDILSALDGPDVPMPVARVTSDVNMRAGPDNAEPVVTIVPAGGEVEVIECAMWCEVMRGDDRGWIFRDFVDHGGNAEPGGTLPPA